MKHFKQFLKEALTSSQEKKVATWTKRTAKATEATDPYFGKGVEDRHEDLDETQDKSEMHQAVEKHLARTITPEEYKGGHMTDKYNRQVRIGAVLGKTKAPAELARRFENDTTRQGKGFTGLSVRTTRSASGVAGQTSGKQSWADESCKNFASGCNKHYLPDEVEHGTVVSYLHDNKGTELARTTFQPHTNDAGNTIYRQNSYYGIKHAGFMAHNKKTEEELTGEHKGGSTVYRINPHVYNNAESATVIHPKATSEDIKKTQESPIVSERSAVMSHPNATPEHIDKALDDSEYRIRQKAALHPKASSENLMKALNDKDYNVRMKAPQNPNFTAEHITKAMNDDEPSVRLMAIRNPKATQEHLNLGINDRDFDVRSAVMEHPKATAEHITSVMKGTDRDAKQIAMRHPNVTNEHITKALDDPSPLVRMAAIEHPSPDKITPEHLTKALADENKGVRLSALRHPNATKEHLEKGVEDENDLNSSFASNRLSYKDYK